MSDQNEPRSMDPAAVRRGRLIAGALFAIALIPVLLATLMYYTGWMVPTSTTNKGDLVARGESIFDTGLVGSNGEALEQRFMPDNEDATWWFLIVADPCEAACQEWLYLSRQVHIRLHREADKVQRAFWSPNPEVLDRDEHPLIEVFSHPDDGLPILPEGVSPADGPFVYIVDRMGTFALRYDESHEGSDLLDDIKHLIKTSPHG